jgi:hypothetical protein
MQFDEGSYFISVSAVPLPLCIDLRQVPPIRIKWAVDREKLGPIGDALIAHERRDSDCGMHSELSLNIVDESITSTRPRGGTQLP